MYKVEILTKEQVEKLVSLCERDNLQYSEYSFLTKPQLSNYFQNRIRKTFKDSNAFSFIALCNNEIRGLICCAKEHFDSEIFGFGCYRITDLLYLSGSADELRVVTENLLTSLEEVLLKQGSPIYISISLNNNLPNAGYLFNAITQKNYYYLHTLLTFCTQKKRFEVNDFYLKEKLLIREANDGDVEQVAELARKSFKYSRFHLDPYLDKERASELLKTSAINSIHHGFVNVMFVAEINKKIVGYYSAKKRTINEFEKTIGDAVIAAVDAEYRGLGIFNKLDSHVLNWFSEFTDFAEMGTYLANYPVHKTWINKELALIRGVHQFSKFIS